jgi:iron complex transport system substrate-binding protein
VSLAPSLTETVFALGAGDRLVGVTDHDAYPAAAAALPRVGGFASPSIEAIVSLRPDLVLATEDGNPEGVVVKLRSLGIPVDVQTPRTFGQIEATCRSLGSRLELPDRGESLAASLAARRARVTTGLAGAPQVRCVLLLSVSPLITCSKSTFLHELITTAGGENLAAALPGNYPVLSPEGLVLMSPPVVVVATMEPGNPTPPAGGWRVVPLDPDLASRPGPRLYDALERLAAALHPERFPR